jgi:hypothetical protein
MPHVLKHVPAARGDAEGSQISQIDSFLRAAAEDIHSIVDKGSRVPFTGHGDIPNAVELSPSIRARLVGPDVVEPGDAICTAKQVQLILP